MIFFLLSLTLLEFDYPQLRQLLWWLRLHSHPRSPGYPSGLNASSQLVLFWGNCLSNCSWPHHVAWAPSAQQLN